MLNPIIAQGIEFTNVYKQYKDAPVPIREAMCFKAQYPALLPAVKEGDMYAGRRSGRRATFFGPVWWSGYPNFNPKQPVEGKQGGYVFDFAAVYEIAKTDEEKKAMDELNKFWTKECTMSKIHAQVDSKDGVGFLYANNLDKLVTQGLPGLKQEVNQMPESDFKTGLLSVLETVTNVIRNYQQQAEENGLTDIANNLSAIAERPPATIYEALQLILIFELMCHERHYEINRLDVALGDIYVQQIDSGAMTKEQIIEEIRGFYQMIMENGDITVCRLMLGGKGRRNADNADRFIEAAFLAEQRHKQVAPQVSLRFYKGINPNLLTLAYETINITGTFPTLYNDDALLDGVVEAYKVLPEEASNFYPLGCGEIIMAHQSPALLVVGWSIPETIHKGIRAATGSTFDELYQSVLTQIKLQAEIYASYHRVLVDTHNNESAFLMAALLNDDCIKRGKPLLNGGAKYNGGCVMGHGFTNAADALTAIKKLVYEDKNLTLEHVLKALDANFKGHEDIRKALLAAPKYGNDDTGADQMLARLWRDISIISNKAGEEVGFDFFTVSSVNPGGYWLGSIMGATADGRLAGEPFAIGNAPAAGRDKNGLTALMNSVLKTDPANGGTMTNFKVSREFFSKERGKFEALFSAYWAGGGLQANVTIVNKGDLEAALKEPEKFPHLLVRLGGWTARFIDLEPPIQKEILERTLY